MNASSPQQTVFEHLVDGDALTIRLPVFEGPLDLLLYLIRRNEVSIYEIPIGTITSQYLSVLHTMDQLNLEVAGEFFVMAATLMYIKSRMLLPRDQRLGEETTEEGEDPRWELVQQLLEYRHVKETALDLEQRIASQQEQLPRLVELPPETASSRPLKPFDRFEIWNTFNLVLRRLAEKMQVGEIHEEPVTVSDRMADIVQLLGQSPRLRFSQLFEDRPNSLYLLTATFLAVLELTRIRAINLSQNIPFGDIDLERAHPEDEPSSLPLEASFPEAADSPPSHP
ncbi:MAG: segregation and condensation protein A [Puniceicoccaceae bacterium]